MAIQYVNNLLFSSTPLWGQLRGNITINGANESVSAIGRLRFQGGASPKTISSAGGQILLLLGATTFATATTTFRVGLMDVDTATGLEDGTFDVYKEYVQGVDALVGTRFVLAPMAVGSKTVNDGDLIAIVAKMPVWAGADTIAIATVDTCDQILPTAFTNFPYGATNTTGTLARGSVNILMALVRTDDGTIGWIEGCPPPWVNVITNITFGSTSSPDEYIGTFVAPFTMRINAMGHALSGILGTDPFETILYRDPYGSPVAMQTVTADPDVGSQVAGNTGLHLAPMPATTLLAGTTYGIAIRPTTLNTINIGYINFAGAGAVATSAMMTLIKGACFLPQLKFAGRTDQTGPFVEVATTHFPLFVVSVCGLDDGAGAAATTVAYASA